MSDEGSPMPRCTCTRLPDFTFKPHYFHMTGRILSSYAPDNLRAGSSNRSGHIAVIDICCILETCNSSNGGVSALNPGCVIIASLNTAVYKATVC